MDFIGKTAIVTGAASGIGLEIATQLLANGAAVLLVDVNCEDLENTYSMLQNQMTAKRVKWCVTDVTRADQVERMVTTAIEYFGTIHLLAHSAGIGLEKAFLETTLAEWQRVIYVDLTGTFICNQAVAREMARNGYGRIVNLASTAGVRGGTGRAAYGAAKGGVINLTKVMAVELATYGITVNALAPGAIETELVAKMHSPQTRTTYTNAIPANRYGTPAETASAAIYLLSDEARYINGHILAVDGGYLAAGLMPPK